MRPWRLGLGLGLPALVLLLAAAGLSWVQAERRGQRLQAQKRAAELLAQARAADALEKTDLVGRFGLLAAQARADQPQTSVELTQVLESLNAELRLVRLSPRIGEAVPRPRQTGSIRIEDRSIELQAGSVTAGQLLELLTALPAHINGAVALEKLTIERVLPVGEELLERLRSGERPEVLRADVRLSVGTLRMAPNKELEKKPTAPALPAAPALMAPKSPVPGFPASSV
jgi:hypothetical protein